MKRYRTLIIILGTFAIYHVGVAVFGLSPSAIIAVYAVLILAALVVFRAAFLSLLASISYSAGNKERAKRLFRLSIKHKARNPNTYAIFAIVMLQEGEGDAALELLRTALAMNPAEAVKKNLLFTTANSHWYMGNIGSAIETMEGMVENYGDVDVNVLSSLGYLYILAGDFSKAKSTTERGLADAPQTATLWDNMGQIHMHEGDDAKAVAAFEKALEIKSDLVDCAYFLGMLHEKAGEAGRARDYFLQARGCRISRYNTVTAEQVDAKYSEYLDMGYDDEDAEEQEE